MEPGKFQPKADIKKTISQMARVQRLSRFDDLDIVERYAAKFGQDADWVYDHTSFGTITNFLVKWKEQDEFNERFQYFWEDHHKPK